MIVTNTPSIVRNNGIVVECDHSTLEEKIIAFKQSPLINRTRWENKERHCVYGSNNDYIKLNTRQTSLIYRADGHFRGVANGKGEKIVRTSVSSADNILLFDVYTHGMNDSMLEFSSFRTSMVTEDIEKLVQLQRYDLRGHNHPNSILAKMEDSEDIELYLKYFKDQAKCPHFHFCNAEASDKLAINLDNLIKYVHDLMHCGEEDDIFNYSLGMPFLAMKRNKRLSEQAYSVGALINDLKAELAGLQDRHKNNPMAGDITDFLKGELDNWNLCNLTASSLEFAYVKLRILKLFNDTTESIMETLRENPDMLLNPDMLDFIYEFAHMQLMTANSVTAEAGNHKQKDYNKEDGGMSL